MKVFSRYEINRYAGRSVLSACITKLLLTPWNRVLPEKLTSSQLLKKFTAFHTTRRFITIFIKARHLSLSWTRLIESVPPTHYSKSHFNIIHPSTPRSFKWSSSLRFPPKILYAALLSPMRVTWPDYLSFLDFITRMTLIRYTTHNATTTCNIQQTSSPFQPSPPPLLFTYLWFILQNYQQLRSFSSHERYDYWMMSWNDIIQAIIAILFVRYEWNHKNISKDNSWPAWSNGSHP
jgi:hypothetical protein